MSKRAGLTFTLTFFLIIGFAQERLSFEAVDKKSYDLFTRGQWHELIDFSYKARRQGIDFFYLQARTGIAYYTLKKYRQAAYWFEKACKTDNTSDWLQEYLYYSLLFGGRSTEASLISSGFSKEIKRKIGFAKKKITRIGLEGGFSFNSDFQNLIDSKLSEKANVGVDYGEAYYLKNYHFESFDLSY